MTPAQDPGGRIDDSLPGAFEDRLLEGPAEQLRKRVRAAWCRAIERHDSREAYLVVAEIAEAEVERAREAALLLAQGRNPPIVAGIYWALIRGREHHGWSLVRWSAGAAVELSDEETVGHADVATWGPMVNKPRAPAEPVDCPHCKGTGKRDSRWKP